MPTYFVRRTLGVSGHSYAELWNDVKETPDKSVEHGVRIKSFQEVTEQDREEWHKSKMSLLDFMKSKYPEPEEPKEVLTKIETEPKETE